ncbi:MAG TPA: DUF6259 domain-containing protein [Gaiellaceae bacterium]|nr:DUF6259 domain-containing protein [Gaiellaceae bacterium]
MPWRLRLEDGTVLDTPVSFACERRDGGLCLSWESERGDELEATVSPDDDTLRFRISARPVRGPAPEVVEYPVIGGIGALSGEDALVHSYATGLLFHNPLELFRGDGEGTARGVVHAPYPEGFSGATMQLMAYYAAGRGGFSFSADDETGAQKWFDFAKRGDHLEASFGHGSPDLGRPLEPAYDVIVAPLLDGNWWEAADRYKAWAAGTRWCAARRERPRWLFEEVGVCTFGINAGRDRSRWLRAIRELAGAPVFHVLGPNWSHVPGDYRGTLPGGLDDWFPAQLDEANLAAIRERGDRVAPFFFDLLFGRDRSEHEAGVAALQQIPDPPLSVDAYTFPFLCPATPFARTLHRERDARLVRETGVDAVYYDISANNVIKRCSDASHGHPRGGGAFLVDAYRELYSDPPGVVRGTEMINEVFVDRLDFYQARAEASPVSSFEADRYRDWVKDGSVEKVPLFAYVYHEHGPVRLDGWAKLSRETGELFYWVGARVLAWGGLFELNYEFSPLENVDGVAEPLDEHYALLPDHRYDVDPEKAAFVRELAAARTGPANRYLAYGTMLPPLPIRSPRVGLEWFQYNSPQEWPAYEDRGVREVDAVVHCAWRHGSSAAVVLVNVGPEPVRVEVPLSAGALRLDDARRRVSVAGGGELGPLGPVQVELPSRRVVVLEIA